MEKPLPGQRAGVGVCAALVPGLSGGLKNVGPELFECLQPDRGLEHEHAGIPEVTTFGQVLLRGGGVGLFHKALDRHGGFAAACACLDVAVARFRPAGLDAQNDDAAIGSFPDGLLHGLGESSSVGNGLVGRGDDQHWVGAVLLCG